MSFGVRRLKLDSFRNYSSLDVELGSGFTILAGQNAQGKTNFLEALYLVSTGRLLRGQRDAEAILSGERSGRVVAELVSGTEITVQIEAGLKKKIQLNGASVPRTADILGRLPCVTITVFDLELVRGEPSDRRLFLDLELSTLYPSYLRQLSLYKRALEQRNALLKLAQERTFDASSFEVWESQLAESGAALRDQRKQYVGRLGIPAEILHREMSNVGERLELSYLTKDVHTTSEELLRAYCDGRSQEIYRGTTTIGPHRDDLLIAIEGRDSRLFGSQGQQRTAVIALKLATLRIGSEILGAKPLLLLDDMLSDLDPDRRRHLCEIVLAEASQAVLTCTEAEAAGKDILGRAQVYTVIGGTIARVCPALDQ